MIRLESFMDLVMFAPLSLRLKPVSLGLIVLTTSRLGHEPVAHLGR
jgi:hypothetical protein